LNQNPSLYIQAPGGIYFTKLKIGLNQFGAFLQNSQKKNRKEKEKRFRKEEKGRGKPLGPAPDSASAQLTHPEPVPSLLSHSH
jgi:hypothetical protein